MANKKESLEKLEQHHQVFKNIGNIVSLSIILIHRRENMVWKLLRISQPNNLTSNLRIHYMQMKQMEF
jgi:hypothetical protein